MGQLFSFKMILISGSKWRKQRKPPISTLRLKSSLNKIDVTFKRQWFKSLMDAVKTIGMINEYSTYII